MSQYILTRVIQGQVKPCLTQLNQDVDVDVKYFAAEALAGVSISCTFQVKPCVCVSGGKICSYLGEFCVRTK